MRNRFSELFVQSKIKNCPHRMEILSPGPALRQLPRNPMTYPQNNLNARRLTQMRTSTGSTVVCRTKRKFTSHLDINVTEVQYRGTVSAVRGTSTLGVLLGTARVLIDLKVRYLIREML